MCRRRCSRPVGNHRSSASGTRWTWASVVVDRLRGLGDNLVAEFPLDADHALACAGLHGNVNGFARLEQRRDAGERSHPGRAAANLNVGELERAGTRS